MGTMAALTLATLLAPLVGQAPEAGAPRSPLHTYALLQDGTAAAYDEACAVASLQGIINRSGPELYLFARGNSRPRYWLDILSTGGRWLEGRVETPHTDLAELVTLAGDRLKGAVIWDPAVPASVNVATTAAGVLDGVVLSPELADAHLAAWGLPVLLDLRGQFTGAETGSAKNDAYRWAVRKYLAKGLCSSRFLCLFEDSFGTREQGLLRYVMTRDWAVYQRSFVFDLSPWADEVPADDPGQRLGLDNETYTMILAEVHKQAAGRHMTELTGFFNFGKYSNVEGHPSRHDPVPTEWESVWLMSPYNCFQNTVSSDCFNQSLHSQALRRPLAQHPAVEPVKVEKKTYLCVLMADYDSATPLYEFLPNHWHSEGRGKLPLAWGINPNLLDTYPDLIEYFYSTATPQDTFTSDASAAGYMNPNRIRPESMPLFIEHNQRYFREADMTIAPMVLDWDQPTDAVKDAFTQFSPDGFATIVMDLHGNGGVGPRNHVWKGMPVTNLINDGCNFSDAPTAAATLSAAIDREGATEPSFHFSRIVWTDPKDVIATVEALEQLRPDLHIEVLGPGAFFAALRQQYGP